MELLKLISVHKKALFLQGFFLLFHILSYSQSFYKIEGEFSIKSKLKENETNLTKGNFFFDRNKSVLFYDISFPEKQVQYNKGNKLFVLKDKKVINSSISEMPIEFTVFSLALSQKLVDYGLSSNGSSKLEKVEKENDLFYNSWVINI